MRYCLAFTLAALFLLSSPTSAQDTSASASGDTNFWVNYWAQPRVILFGPEEEEFYKNMQSIMFPWDVYDNPSNPSALDTNAQWLKDHPSINFYVHGYASSRGQIVYNLALSQRRADWVKRELVKRGVPENRIVLAVGWGQLYPVCPELDDPCWLKNKIVRFDYVPPGTTASGQAGAQP